MINMIVLYFTKEFSAEYEPAQLLLGAGIGIVIVVILIKKIINRVNKKGNELFCKLSWESVIEKGLLDDI